MAYRHNHFWQTNGARPTSAPGTSSPPGSCKAITHLAKHIRTPQWSNVRPGPTQRWTQDKHSAMEHPCWLTCSGRPCGVPHQDKRGSARRHPASIRSNLKLFSSSLETTKAVPCLQMHSDSPQLISDPAAVRGPGTHWPLGAATNESTRAAVARCSGSVRTSRR